MNDTGINLNGNAMRSSSSLKEINMENSSFFGLYEINRVMKEE